MSAGRVSEMEINFQIRDILRDRNPDWEVHAQRTRTVIGGSGRAPDIIIRTNDGGVVIVEMEFSPASGLAGDVQSRLGVQLMGLGRPDAIMGVVLPSGLEKIDAHDTELKYYVVYDGTSSPSPSHTRFPPKGYLKGSLYDVMTAVRQVSIPTEKINMCVELMSNSISRISHVLQTELDEGARQEIIGYIGQPDSTHEQGLDMAALIVLNAGVFHEELARHRQNDVLSLQKLKSVVLDQATLIDAWEKILRIDYAPIFDNAVSILRILPAATAAMVLDEMHRSVSKIIALGVSKSGDMYGSLYQGMLGTDRKRAAAFYTRPEAATLLAGLVMPCASDTAWLDPKKIESMRIADFACGTGMLLTAAVRHIMNNTHNTYDSLTHKHMLEESVYGFDILPTATHLTASNLSGLLPQANCDDMRIYQMPIGEKDKKDGGGGGGGGVRDEPDLGSLDIIRSNTKFTVAGYRHGGKRGLGSTREATVNDESCDYVLMNPPYVRSTNHGGGRTDPVPPFAVFDIPPDLQLKMAEHNKRIFKGTCAHGNAGLGSYFVAIMNRTLKAGGTFGVILPATVVAGDSWKGVRALLGRYYEDLMIVFVGGLLADTDEGDDNVGGGSSSSSREQAPHNKTNTDGMYDEGAASGTKTFSSDTSMNEVLLIGRKIAATKKIPAMNSVARIKLVLLDRLPHTNLEALEAAKSIRSTTPNSLETDMGDTSVILGDSVIGKMLDCPAQGARWWVGRVRDTRLLSYMYNLTRGNIPNIPISILAKYASVGKHHLDIWGAKKDGTLQGPFNKIPLYNTSKYKALWSNNCNTQRCMVVEPNLTLEKKHDATQKQVQNVLDTATHVYLNAQLRYTSQHIVAAYTKQKHVGGRAWVNIILQNPAYEKVLALWFNSVFGILTYWSYAGAQQLGRGIMGGNIFRTMPILDFDRLSKNQIKGFDRLFEETCGDELLVINRLDEDPVRQKIDRGIMKILGIGDGDGDDDVGWLYRQIAAEPQFARTDTVPRTPPDT